MENLVKIDDSELANEKMTGSYLFSKNGVNYFNDSFCHSIFVGDNQNTNNAVSSFEQHVTKELEVFGKVKNSPSVVMVGVKAFDGIKNALGEKYVQETNIDTFVEKSVSESVITYAKVSDFEELIDKLIRARSLSNYVDENGEMKVIPQSINVFVCCDDEKIEHFLEIVTVARSRFIYFTILAKNKTECAKMYGAETFDMICDNCKLVFNMDEKGIASVTKQSISDPQTIAYEQD